MTSTGLRPCIGCREPGFVEVKRVIWVPYCLKCFLRLRREMEGCIIRFNRRTLAEVESEEVAA